MAAPQQPERKISVGCWVPLFFLFAYIVLGCAGALAYYINDDVGIIYILQQGEYHTPATHSVLGFILKWLYTWKETFFWYALFITMAYVAGIGRLFLLLAACRKLSYPVMLLVTAFVLLGLLPFQPNATILSLLLAMVAILPFLIENVEQASSVSFKTVLSSFIFLFVACLYRSPAVFLMTGCALGIHVLLNIRRSAQPYPPTETNDFRKRAVIITGMMVFAFLMHMFNLFLYNRSPEHSRLLEYNMYRHNFTDSSRYRYTPALQKLGISENDFHMMTFFMGIDSPPLHLENLKRVPPVPAFNPDRMGAGLKRAVYALTHGQALILTAFLLFTSVFSRQARIISGGTVLTLLLIALYTCRMVPRICLPFLTFGAVTVTAFLGPGFHNIVSRKRKPFFYTAIMMVLLAALWMTLKQQTALIDNQKRELAMAGPVWRFCEANNIQTAACWPGAVSDGRHVLFTPIQWPKTPRRLHFIGGWTGSYPKILQRLRSTYGHDIYAGLALPGTYHLVMNASTHASIFERFIQEHGPKGAAPQLLLVSGRTRLYRIVETETGPVF